MNSELVQKFQPQFRTRRLNKKLEKHRRTYKRSIKLEKSKLVIQETVPENLARAGARACTRVSVLAR